MNEDRKPVIGSATANQGAELQKSISALSVILLGLALGVPQAAFCAASAKPTQGDIWSADIEVNITIKASGLASSDHEFNGFTAHLKHRGRLERTALALDEREEAEMTSLCCFLKATAPESKVSMAALGFDGFLMRANYRCQKSSDPFIRTTHHSNYD
ncbi:MAG: hypothetical protein RLZZ282_1483 [Verrucomicrobiota bacterium]